MAGEDHSFSVWGFIKGFGKLLIGLLLIVQGVIGLIVMLLFVGIFISIASSMSGSGPSVQIPQGAALHMHLDGVLVEQPEVVDPFQKALRDAYGRDEPQQIGLHDVVRSIRKAREDKRVSALVLDLARLQVPLSSASKLHYIASEIEAFRAAGKKVIAVGDSYTQEQYLLAAHADEIILGNYGGVVLYGYGSYQTYVRSLLEKLKVTSHVFRVGTYKSAVEPFMRDDMSPEAKEANITFLNALWREYAASAERARNLPQGAIHRYADELGELLRANRGDFARTALDYRLVDSLKSRAELQDYLRETFGADAEGKSFKRVGFSRYLSSISGDEDRKNIPNVAVVTAAGVIVDGEAPAGAAAGGDTIAGYLKKAREDDNVKAVVLRVDSPGGSAFASEVIRDQVVALRKAGKPVVVSMGSLAASGGYWISAAADEIWATPTTITGSIGIFGFFPTFERTAAEIGVYIDGVGTTSLAPLLATGIGPLPESAADIIQQSVENGYDRFLSIVSDGRSLDRDYVDSIGQGRVWIGSAALDLKLVDKIGTFEDAVAAAAARAELEEYDVVEMIERLSPWEKFLSGLGAQTLAAIGAERVKSGASVTTLGKLISAVETQLSMFDGFNDPQGVYARCLPCETN